MKSSSEKVPGKSEGAGGNEDHLINLNEAQSRNIWRNTMIITSIFGIYVLTGIIVFSGMCGWDILDAVYFICITFSTVGYGDYNVDHTPQERLFTSFFLLIGLIAIGSFLSVYMQMMQDHAEATASERNKKISKYLAEYRDKDLGSRILSSMKRASHEVGHAFSRTLSRSSSISISGQPGESPLADPQAEQGSGTATFFSRLSASLPFSEQKNEERDNTASGGIDLSTEEKVRLSHITEMSLEQSRSTLGTTKGGGLGGANALMAAHERQSGDQRASGGDGDVITLEDEREFTKHGLDEEDQANLRNTLDLLRDRQCKAQEEQEKRRMPMEDILMRTYDEDIHNARNGALWSVLAIVTIIVGGMLAMMKIEDWDADWAFYWACQTVTTVGYGDCPPNSRNGKVFTIFYIIFGVGYLANAVANAVKYPLLMRTRHVEAKVLNQFAGDLSEAMLSKIFHSEIYERHPDLRASEDSMSKSEFILLLLEMMNKVEEKDIVLASRVFDKLDINGDGDLSTQDMTILKEKARAAEEQKRLEERKKAEAEADILMKATQRFNSGEGGDFFTPGRRGSFLDILGNSFGLTLSGRVDATPNTSRSGSRRTTPQRSLDEMEGVQPPGGLGSGGLNSFLESDVGTPESSSNKGKNENKKALAIAAAEGSVPSSGASGGGVTAASPEQRMPDTIPPRLDLGTPSPLHYPGAQASLRQPLNPEGEKEGSEEPADRV